MMLYINYIHQEIISCCLPVNRLYVHGYPMVCRDIFYLLCLSCFLSKYSFPDVAWKVSHYCRTEFGQPEHQLHVLIPYIESSSFSFCCFHHSFYDFVDDDDNLAVNGMLVLWELPAWLMRALSLFLTSFDLAFI